MEKKCCPKYEIEAGNEVVYLFDAINKEYKPINGSTFTFEQRTVPPGKTEIKAILTTSEGKIFQTPYRIEEIDEFGEYAVQDELFDIVNLGSTQPGVYEVPGVGTVSYDRGDSLVYSFITIYDPNDPFYDDDEYEDEPEEQILIGPNTGSAPETFSDEDGNFEIIIPSIDDDPCIAFLFIGGSTYVPDNIKYGEPEIVPLIAGELGQYELDYYVKELGFKPPEKFTPAEQEAVKIRLMEDYPEMSIDCINSALGIESEENNSLLTKPSTVPTSSQMINITGQVVGEIPDNNSNVSTQGVYNATVFTSDEFGGKPTQTSVRTKSDTEGNFQITVPDNTKFISARIKSDASNATPDSFLVDSVDFNFVQTSYLLQLKLQQTDPVKITIPSKTSTLKPKPPTLLITAEGYESMELIPYKGDGTPKPDIGDIELTPIKKSLENDKITASQLDEATIKSMSSSKKTADYYITKRLFKTVQNLKNVLIPIVLGLLAKFGITKAQELLGKTKEEIREAIQNRTYCPPQDQIKIIIQKKNRVVKGLNNTLKIIDVTTTALGIVGGLLTGLQIAINLVAVIPIPMPPIVPIAIPKLEKVIAKLKAGNAGLLAILVLLRQTLSLIIELLGLLDMLIQNCVPDNELEQEEINAEILALIEEQAANNSPIITIVNGFTMGIETENTTEPLKRKRATATNADGVVMLRGEFSFSSIEQILIDELVFYIQVNDLKAD